MGDDRRSSKAAEVRRDGAAQRARLAPGLYVVATPIGNLRDITLRALEVLGSAELVLCEDTRVTRKLLERHNLAPKLLAYHDHNAASVRPRVLETLANGAAVALVSDAGTPLVSDPGFKLVEATIEAGHRVFPIPGASAALAALVSAGLPSDRFFFEGFLPPKSAARKNRLSELRAIPATLIFYESGPRLADSLADMAATLGARNAAVCRELTKAYEERLKNDASLQRFVVETEETLKSYKETRVSLNEAARKKEMEVAEKRKAANDKLNTKVVGKEGTPLDLMEMEDEYLREGLFVLSDLINTKLG